MAKAEAIPTGNLPDWFTPVDVIRAKVQLTANDYAVIVALPQSELLQRAQKLLDLDKALGVGDAISEEDIAHILAVEDDVLAPTIESWSLEDICKAYDLKAPVPSTLDKEARAALWASLPMTAIRRLITGVTLHLGNV